MDSYHKLLTTVMVAGTEHPRRNASRVRSISGGHFNHQFCHHKDHPDLYTLPIITTKKIFFRGVVEELLWFMRGSTDLGELVRRDVHFWDDNGYEYYRRQCYDKKMADEEILEKDVFIQELKDGGSFNMGPIYGERWRRYGAWEDRALVDQLARAIAMIKSDPYSSRIIVDSWHPATFNDGALPPCHSFFQFKCNPDNTLDLILYQRSADVFLGVPFNITSYSLLLLLVCKMTDRDPGEFIHFMGDTHIYAEHYAAVGEQLTREPYPLPAIKIPDIRYLEEIDSLSAENFELLDYKSHPTLKAPMAV